MASPLGFLDRLREPTARLDETKFVLFAGLDLTEVGAAMALTGIPTVLLIGAELPAPLKVAALTAWPLLTFMLYGVKREGRAIADWVTVLVPYALRRKRFRNAGAASPDPRLELVDAAIAPGVNLISWEFVPAAEGDELHLYEEPSRPYRALAGYAAEATGPSPFATWSTAAIDPAARTSVELP
jgi:hypothetical protein